ncbi:F0F1 ATP synthase subunit delta [Tumebacillus sp. ITR2]|uniref:ATP synthase subunit delta n=1 Tax=Tumebacillus amylolyticus TaxID=2801339 RepID=A0ABS1J5F5_9BACL|nr:F0F1 ATP synthase subunit delta [Tumebacillus amylolyticus]MBL0385440.1 F0F1 ATP synthase subunit delta [Tumebacillus amylolyticus]
MKNATVAKRYAEALFEVAQQQGNADTVQAELSAITDALKAHPELEQMLLHPSISTEVKKKQMNELFNGRVSAIVMNFIQLLLDRRRQEDLHSIAEEFTVLADKASGRVKVKVESATPLSEEEISTLKNTLGANGKQIEVTATVNPALIGGAKVRVGDTVFDYTVAAQLERFRQTLKY